MTATIAVGLSTAPGYARIIRGQFVAIRSSQYVEAARVLGHARGAHHRAPRAAERAHPDLRARDARHRPGRSCGPSALSYLGLGAQPPAPEWGAMLAAGRTYLSVAWWMTVFPGLMIVGTTIATTVLGPRARTSRKGRRMTDPDPAPLLEVTDLRRRVRRHRGRSRRLVHDRSRASASRSSASRDRASP